MHAVPGQVVLAPAGVQGEIAFTHIKRPQTLHVPLAGFLLSGRPVGDAQSLMRLEPKPLFAGCLTGTRLAS